MMTGLRRRSPETATVTTGDKSPSADEGIDELYRQVHVRTVRLAVMLTGNAGAAEELLQEAFVRVWRSWDRIRDVDAAHAYLRTTVVNLSRSFLRRRTLEVRHRFRRVDDAVQIDPDVRIDLLRAVAKLPARQRACVALRFYEDLSEPQTAELLGISVGAVKSQTHKALQRLETFVGGDQRG
jgi:RNA polymerase sigma-70 factor (sigma-E family)